MMLAPPMPFLPPEAHGKLMMMMLLAYAGDRGRRARDRAVPRPGRALGRPDQADAYPELYKLTEGGH